MGHSVLQCEDKFLRLAMDLEVGGVWGTSLRMPHTKVCSCVLIDYDEKTRHLKLQGEKNCYPLKKNTTQDQAALEGSCC